MSTLARALSLISAIFMLTACGGGGSAVSRDNTDNGSGDDGTTTPTYSIALTLENESGTSDNNLSENNSLFAVATVTDDEGNPYSDALLTFTLSNEELAEFGNDTGTARTNSSGVARIRLNASTASGDGEITAALSSGETGTTTFSATAVSATEPTTISVALSLQNESGEADNNLSSSNALTAVATVTNSLGEPQADLLLTFSLSNDELATFSNDTATALTNAEGVATIGMSVGSASGDGEVTATLPTGETDSTTFSSEGSTTVSEEPASLELFADSIQLASSGSDEVDLIALVKNEQSVLMEGVEVSFSAQTGDGVELQLTQPETLADGTARAVLTSQNDKSNRTITVTAEAGSLTETVDITIIGTEVTINGASSVILNDTVEYTIRLQDSDGQSINNEDVVLSATSGTLSSTIVNTGTNGQATVSYTATSSGEDTITASALNAETSFTVQVQQDEFNFVNLPKEEVPLGQAQTITVQWRQDNEPVVGQEVTFSASRGEIAGEPIVVTDADGQASIEISADNAGISSISASASDANGNALVSALTQIEFIATTPATLIADASPDILGPDGQTSTISAVVRDVDGNLVKNSVVNFSVSDVSTGFVSPSQATTDSKGIATTVFTSGSVTSEDDVVITATVADDETVYDEIMLTVGARAFDIVIGTGNVIETPTTTSYLKRFAIFVSDSVGRPVSGVNLTASITPVKFGDTSGRGVYLRGEWEYNTVNSIWETVNVTACDNEDKNSNGILEAVEDLNNDEQLTPGIVGTVTLTNDGVTDENGYAELEYRYPESYAVWYFAEVTVFGQSTGSESQASMKYRLEILSDDITDEGITPPENPFGVGICPEDEDSLAD
ncbi:Ig-like domain-containing protein [Alteromonas sp. HB246098]